MTLPLHLKYRPRAFAGVIGQDHVTKSLVEVMRRRSARAFLFSGPSGTGKTTLARICADGAGCGLADILEIDGATYTGIDDMRAVAAGLRYRPIGGADVKAVIVDECHSLSKQAWQSLLKILEEPPAHVYWFLCTTEPTKLPTSVKTRCLSYDLRPVSLDALRELLDDVVKREALKLPGDLVQLCVQEANGSPRQALVNLEACRSCKTRAEAVPLLRAAADSPEVYDLLQALIKNAPWEKLRDIVACLKDQNPESARIAVVNYVAAVLANAGPKEAPRLLNILEAFSTPCNSSDKMGPIFLAIGRVIFSA